jgi:hypothetical protein
MPPSGYAFLEKVSEDESFSLARGRRDSDGMPVLVKAPELLRALEQEYRLAAKLESAWAFLSYHASRVSSGKTKRGQFDAG